MKGVTKTKKHKNETKMHKKNMMKQRSKKENKMSIGLTYSETWKAPRIHTPTKEKNKIGIKIEKPNTIKQQKLKSL